MALQTKIGNPSGTTKNAQVEVNVFDTSMAPVNESDALAAAVANRPASLFGGSLTPKDEVNFEQLSGTAYRFTFNYEEAELTDPIDTRSVASITKPKRLTRFVETIAVLDSSGDVTANYPDLKWQARKSGGEDELADSGEVVLNPLTETRSADFFVPSTLVTDDYLNGIEALVAIGAFNNDTYLGKPACTLQLVRFDAYEHKASEWKLSFGFGYLPIQSNVYIDTNIVLPTVRPCDYYYTVHRPTFGTGAKILQPKVMAAVIGRAWDVADFDGLLPQ